MNHKEKKMSNEPLTSPKKDLRDRLRDLMPSRWDVAAKNRDRMELDGMVIAPCDQYGRTEVEQAMEAALMAQSNVLLAVREVLTKRGHLVDASRDRGTIPYHEGYQDGYDDGARGVYDEIDTVIRQVVNKNKEN